MVSERTSRRVFTGLVLLSIALLFAVALPFLQAFILAAVLAGALRGPYYRLLKVTRGKQTPAATLLVALVLFAIVLPIGSLAALVVNELISGAQALAHLVQSEGVLGVVHHMPHALQGPTERALALFPEGAGRIQEKLTAQGPAAAAAVGGVVKATGSAVFQTAMMLIALFFFLVEGRKLVSWLESVSPLKKGQLGELLHEFRKVSISVLTSTVATAGVQAAAALVGYLIARVPSPVFFTLLTFFTAFIPSVGAASVCFVAAAILFFTGHLWAAVFLAAWAVFVVGLVDNVVKPILIKGGLEIHGALVFFALLGGLAMFGPIGLIAGPLIVSFFLALVRLYQRDYQLQPTPPLAGTKQAERGVPERPTHPSGPALRPPTPPHTQHP